MISQNAGWILYFVVGTGMFIAGLLLTRKTKDDK
jgi:hypothetical protein